MSIRQDISTKEKIRKKWGARTRARPNYPPAGPGVRGTPLLLSMSIRSVRFSISYTQPISYKLSSIRYRISQELKIVTKFSYPLLFNCSIPEKLPCPTERAEKLLVRILEAAAQHKVTELTVPKKGEADCSEVIVVGWLLVVCRQML